MPKKGCDCAHDAHKEGRVGHPLGKKGKGRLVRIMSALGPPVYVCQECIFLNHL